MVKPNREVTEFDLRAPEFQRHDVRPEDYEFRHDGKVVRKDRWQTGMMNIASILVGARAEYEIPDIVEQVRLLATRHGVGPDGAMRKAIDALEAASNGLKWYRDTHPQDVNGADDEADEQIKEALAALKEALGIPAGEGEEHVEG